MVFFWIPNVIHNYYNNQEISSNIWFINYRLFPVIQWNNVFLLYQNKNMIQHGTFFCKGMYRHVSNSWIKFVNSFTSENGECDCIHFFR